MVSRQETARQLLTPGEVMQLPSDEEIVLVSGVPPIRATKIRYYLDNNFKARVSPPPALNDPNHPYGDCPPPRRDDWGSITADVHQDLSIKTFLRLRKGKLNLLRPQIPGVKNRLPNWMRRVNLRSSPAQKLIIAIHT